MALFKRGATKETARAASVDYVVVGLGNPGADYEHTRHNAGFDVIDQLASMLSVNYWKHECGCLVARATWDGHKLLLAKPQSFMNTSGGPVRQLMNAYGIDGSQLIVIHDDLDIDAGRLRIKFGGGHGGHNGLRSIVDKTGSADWYRLRVGIGRPPGSMDPADYVLSRPKGEAAETHESAIELAAHAVLALIDEGLEAAQRTYN